jgi:hypothetical protein
MPINYKTCTVDGTVPAYLCDPCTGTEAGRLRGAFYMHKSILSEITDENIALKTWWETQIEAGTIILVPTTRGTFDGGTKRTVTGFGDEKEKIIGKTFTAVVTDPNHKGNAEFYEALENNYSDYYFGFRTASEIRIGTKQITGLEVKDPVEEDTDSIVPWQATVTWDQDKPEMTVPIYPLTDEVKGIFTCYEVVPAP